MLSSERFNGIRAFVQAVDAGSFSEAALQLGLSKSAVGKAIARLEMRLNSRLLHRSTRSLSLTDEGRAFYTSCVRALTELENVETALSNRRVEPAGQLRVSLPSLFGSQWVMPIFLDLADRYEHLQIEATFTAQRADFAEDGIDLVVRIGELDAGATLTARRLGTQRLVVCAAPAYLDAHGRPQAIQDLASHACIGFLKDGVLDPWRFKGHGDDNRSVTVPTRMRLSNVDAVITAVRRGHGIAQLPRWLVAAALCRNEFESILGEYEGPGLPIHVAWPATQMLPPRVRVAVDALTEGLKAQPWE